MKQPKDLKILIAEDNKINQRLAVLTFKQMGLLCDIASNGKIAYEMYQQKEYDLILMDMHMPVMNGLESTQMIRAFEKITELTHRTFIVALTGSEIDDMKEACFSAGMDEFLEKPVLTERLLKLISRISH